MNFSRIIDIHVSSQKFWYRAKNSSEFSKNHIWTFFLKNRFFWIFTLFPPPMPYFLRYIIGKLVKLHILKQKYFCYRQKWPSYSNLKFEKSHSEKIVIFRKINFWKSHVLQKMYMFRTEIRCWFQIWKPFSKILFRSDSTPIYSFQFGPKLVKKSLKWAIFKRCYFPNWRKFFEFI